MDWRETSLKKELDSRDTSETKNAWLEAALPGIQTLLAKSGTAPVSFTLHDDEHSFRVAQRIFDLTPPDTLSNLSSTELWLLLGAAYLHDIGMNPRRDIVLDVRDLLLKGDGNLASTERVLLQEWLDKNYPEEQIPLHQNDDQVVRLNRAEYLTAYYCRHRHNDWSEEHILSISEKLPSPPYAGFCNDLITLCKSHHFGFDELKATQLNAKVVGARSDTVNLRYLAALLRVADVLEFDPERTPEVVFDHRSIHSNSVTYWQKDKYISLKLDKETFALIYSARTETARIHKALLETANDVDRELQNCATLDKLNLFKVGATGCSLSHYIWPWQSALVRDVAPKDGTFEYIEGAFRPDSKRILSLLAGTQLYGTTTASIRELLQNAFDAVKEQIVRELLHDREVGILTSTFEGRGNLHSVKLKIENRKGEVWLVCSDTGAGMTRRVIESYLLVSGSRPRPEVVELRRSAKLLGIDFERSGQFGIGALSYFMIADRVEIETLPSSYVYQDAEGHGWSFTTEGIGHFGELKAITRKSNGSTISLRLRHEFEHQFTSQSVKDIAHQLVCRAPCQISVLVDGQIVESGPGWIVDLEKRKRRLLQGLLFQHERRDEIASRETLENEERNREAWEKLAAKANDCMNFSPAYEETLPDGSGHIRVVIPYFKLEDGNSLYFMNLSHGKIKVPPAKSYDRGEVFCCLPSISFSNNGFDVSSFTEFSKERNVPGILLNVDLTGNAIPSVDRQRVSVRNLRELSMQIESVIESAFSVYFNQNVNSPYNSLCSGLHLVESIPSNEGATHWPHIESISASSHDAESYVWREISFPAIVSNVTLSEYRSPLRREALARHGYVAELRPMRCNGHLLKPLSNCQPSRIALTSNLFDQVVFVYESNPAARIGKHTWACMPSEWNGLLCIKVEGDMAFNSEHAIAKLVDRMELAEFQRNTVHLSPQSRMKAASGKSPRIKAMTLLCLADLTTDQWQGLHDLDPKAMAELFEDVGLEEVGGQLRILTTTYETGLRSVSKEGASFIKGSSWSQHSWKSYENALPKPEDKWWIK